MPLSADFAPSRNGLTLMSVTSTEICAAARHLLILISVSAVFGSFLRSTAQMRSAKWSLVSARVREWAEKSQSDYRLSIARPERATRRRCYGNKRQMGVFHHHHATTPWEVWPAASAALRPVLVPRASSHRPCALTCPVLDRTTKTSLRNRISAAGSTEI